MSHSIKKLQWARIFSHSSSHLVGDAVQAPPVPLQRVHYVGAAHRLPPRVRGVRYRVPDDPGLGPQQTTRVQGRARVRRKQKLSGATRNALSSSRSGSYTTPLMRLTPPRRARRRSDGLEMPCRLSRAFRRWRLAPPWPRPARRSGHPRGQRGRTLRALAATRHLRKARECGEGMG